MSRDLRRPNPASLLGRPQSCVSHLDRGLLRICFMKLRAYLDQNGSPTPTLAAEETLLRAATLMLEREISALPILDGDGQILGILTDKDLLRASAQGGLTDRKVSAFMTRDVITGAPEQTIAQAVAAMARAEVHHLPILDSGRLLTVVSLLELVREAYTEDQEELKWMHEYVYGVSPSSATLES